MNIYIPHVLAYVLGGLLTVSLINTWFNTKLKRHVVGLIARKRFSNDQECDGYIMTWCPFLGELLGCPICLAHWVGVPVALIVSGFAISSIPVGLVFCIFSILTWPWFVFKLL